MKALYRFKGPEAEDKMERISIEPASPVAAWNPEYSRLEKFKYQIDKFFSFSVQGRALWPSSCYRSDIFPLVERLNYL